MIREDASVILGVLLCLVGSLSFVAGTGAWLERAESLPFFRVFIRPYRILSATWLAPSRRWYLRAVGLLLIVLGGLLLITISLA